MLSAHKVQFILHLNVFNTICWQRGIGVTHSHLCCNLLCFFKALFHSFGEQWSFCGAILATVVFLLPSALGYRPGLNIFISHSRFTVNCGHCQCILTESFLKAVDMLFVELVPRRMHIHPSNVQGMCQL